VVSKRGKLGLFVMLRHPPQATGLTFYVFSLYFPLREKSPLTKGKQVRKGQEIAFSGMFADGFQHLHFGTKKSTNGLFKGSTFMNPSSFLSAAGTRATWPCR